MGNEKHVLDRITDGEVELTLIEVSEKMGIKPESIIARHIKKEKEPRLKAYKKAGKKWFVLESELKKYFDAINR